MASASKSLIDESNEAVMSLGTWEYFVIFGMGVRVYFVLVIPCLPSSSRVLTQQPKIKNGQGTYRYGG